MAKKRSPNPPPEIPPVVPTEVSSEPIYGFNERVEEFWRRRQKSIIGVCLLLLTGVLVWQGSLLFTSVREERIQKAFQELGEDEAERLAFTKKYPQAPQSGLVLLQLGHQRYADKAYPKAADFYQQAVQRLEDNPWRSRALLGRAMALTLADSEKGREPLQRLTEDLTVLDSVRAQAAYNLAVLDWDAGTYADMQKRIDFVDQLEYAGNMWQQKIQALKQRIPEIQSDATLENIPES